MTTIDQIKEELKRRIDEYRNKPTHKYLDQRLQSDRALLTAIVGLERIRDNWIGFPSTSNQHAGLDLQTICEQWDK